MSPLSKKQLQHLQVTPGLLACATLLCFPGGIPFSSEIPILESFISGFLALGLAHSLLKLGKLPPRMRIGALLPIACSAPLTLLVLPHLWVELWLLLPFALLLWSQRPRFSTLPTFYYLLALWLSLSAGSAGLLHILTTQINYGLPRLPSHLTVWLCILAVIPLGFASRPMLRPLAKAIARYQIWILLLFLGLYSLTWSAATSFKIPGEPDRNFHSLSPAPRFFLLPKEGIPDLTPSELRESPVRDGALLILNEMGWRLSDPYIASTFPPNENLPPQEMFRAMKLYGFITEDIHGAFLSGESFDHAAPEEMDPSFLPQFRASMDQMVMRPSEIARLLAPYGNNDDPEEIILTLQDLNWIRKVPGEESKYRLTSQARRPFENGLLPRQLLLLKQALPGEEVELVQSEYVPGRELSDFQILEEFSELEILEAAETRPVWQWNQHVAFLMNADRWKSTSLLLLAMILALLAGRCLPDQLPKGSLFLLTLAALATFVQLPHLSGMLPAIRIALGFWIARNLLPLQDHECDRISLFAVCTYITAVLMPLPEGAPLVHQCAWILIWTLPATLCLGFAIRKMSSAAK